MLNRVSLIEIHWTSFYYYATIRYYFDEALFVLITFNRVSLDIMFPPLGAKIITEDQPLVAGRSVKLKI